MLKRLRHKLAQTVEELDVERLQKRYCDAGTVPIGEAPLRVRASAAGVDANALLDALQKKSKHAFDQTAAKLVPLAKGPLDAARVVQAAIREAGRTACDLLRMAL